MSVSDIFSKRQQRQAGVTGDVFVYDEIPATLRIQIVHILGDTLGLDSVGNDTYLGQYKKVTAKLAREYGVFKLANGDSPSEQLFNFLVSKATAVQVLDVAELSLDEARTFDSYEKARSKAKMIPSAAVEELNFRFMEAAVGYQIENWKFVRFDSKFTHAEIVKPALALLSGSIYQGVEQEFLSAHKHYREGKYKECLVDCLKAFESTMKVICDRRGWQYAKTDTAKTLIDVCLSNHLIDPMLLAHVGALRTVLESGIPTLRNKLAGHGQGSAVVKVQEHFAGYALHLTASNILFLVSSDKKLP